MKVYFITFLISFISVIGFNLFMDVEGKIWRGTSDFPKIAKDDQVIVVPANRNERIDRVNQLEKIDTNFEVLVLGSSKALRIGKDYFLNLETRNLAMSTSSIEELAAIWQEFKNRKSAVNVVILSIDPWMINANSLGYDINWLESNEALLKFCNKHKIKCLNFGKSTGNRTLKRFSFYFESFRSNIDFRVLIASITDLFNYGFPQKFKYSIKFESELADSEFSIKKDGTLRYSNDYLSRMNEAKALSEIELYPISKTDYLFLNYMYSSDRAKLIQVLIQDIEDSGTDVVLISTPFHPLAYKNMISRNEYKEIIAEWNLFFDKLTLKKGNKCNYTNPLTVGCQDSDFIDAMHMKESCIKKVFSSCKLTK